MLDGSYKWLRRLESVISSFLTWKGCFPCRSSSRYLFIDRWSGIWQRNIWSFSRADLPSYIVPVDHDKNIVRLFSGSLEAEFPVGETPIKRLCSLTNLWMLRVTSQKASFERWDGFILRTSIGGPRWWASSLKIWRTNYYRPAFILRSGCSVWHPAKQSSLLCHAGAL